MNYSLNPRLAAILLANLLFESSSISVMELLKKIDLNIFLKDFMNYKSNVAYLYYL